MTDVILVAVIIAALLYTLGDSVERPVDPYCEMVTIYQQSGGQYGWPDYRGNYNEVCRHEK